MVSMTNVREKISQGYDRVQKSGFIPFILSLLLYGLDLTTGFGGLNTLQTQRVLPLLIANSWKVFLGLAGLILFYYLVHHIYEGFNKGDIITLIIFTLLFTLILFLGGAIYHLILIILICFFLRYPEKLINRLSGAIFFFILDFFVWGYITSSVKGANQYLYFYFPVFQIYVWNICLKYESLNLLRFLYNALTLMIILIAFFNLIYEYKLYDTSVQLDPNQIKKNVVGYFFEDGIKNMGSSFKSLGSNFVQLFNMSQYTTTPGTEEPVEDPQGLILKAFEQGDRPFRTGSKVYATSMLEAKTLEKPIEAYVICYTEVEDEFGDDVIQYGKINGKTDPVKFTIISFSQHTVRCSFDSLPAGDYEIVFNATFDFASEIRKKIYLMDRQRLMNDQISLNNKGQDSSSENVLKTLYDIDDTDPEPIYTSGPVKLGIGTDNLPIDIGQGEIRETQYSVSIENDWSKGGQISRFNNIYLKIPSTFMFVDDSCDLDITTTSEQSEPDYNTYRLIMDDRFSNIDEAVGVSCIAQIGSNSLDPTPITTKFFKAHVDYTYVMQEEVDVEVEQGPTADEGLNVRNDLCCRVEYNTEIKYYWVVDETECKKYGDAAISSKIADSEKCKDEN